MILHMHVLLFYAFTYSSFYIYDNALDNRFPFIRSKESTHITYFMFLYFLKALIIYWYR